MAETLRAERLLVNVSRMWVLPLLESASIANLLPAWICNVRSLMSIWLGSAFLRQSHEQKPRLCSTLKFFIVRASSYRGFYRTLKRNFKFSPSPMIWGISDDSLSFGISSSTSYSLSVVPKNISLSWRVISFIRRGSQHIQCNRYSMMKISTTQNTMIWIIIHCTSAYAFISCPSSVSIGRPTPSWLFSLYLAIALRTSLL